MTAALTPTPLQVAESADVQAQQTWTRWVGEERLARQEAAAARARLASVQLEDPEAAFDLMATIDAADRRATAAEALAQAARSRRADSTTEVALQQGLELQATAGQLWQAWLDHAQVTQRLLAQLLVHEGTSHELAPRHDLTIGEKMREAAKAMDAQASSLVVSARGAYVVARPGPVVDGLRDLHVGFGAPGRESGVAHYHVFDIEVDGRSWQMGRLQANPASESIEWVTRPVPADATVVVASRSSGESFTLPPAKSPAGTR